MNLKKIKTIGIFVTFLLCFINHFMYEIYPNFIFSILFPVNESIWEHMKMITSSILMWQFIEFIILYKKKIPHNNFLLSTSIMCISSIFIFLIIYYPIYNITGENFILNIICLFITIYSANIIGYIIMNKKTIKCESAVGLICIILLYIVFGYLTYNPPKNKIFLDQTKNKYGI